MTYTYSSKSNELQAELEISRVEERGYVASERFDVGAGATENLHLKNPADSSTDLRVHRFKVNTQFEGNATIYDSFSSDPTGGTEAGVDNLLLDTGEQNGETLADVNTGVTFTANNPHMVAVIPSGGFVGTTGGAFENGGPIIEPDREIVLEVENESGSADGASLTIIYSERPQ